jgi:hypothetical protein
MVVEVCLKIEKSAFSAPESSVEKRKEDARMPCGIESGSGQQLV